MSGLTVEALKSGNLKPAMLLFANKCLFELLRQSPVPIKEVTTLLRAITSAEAHTMRQTVYEREQAELKERERVRKVEEGWRMTHGIKRRKRRNCGSSGRPESWRSWRRMDIAAKDCGVPRSDPYLDSQLSCQNYSLVKRSLRKKSEPLPITRVIMIACDIFLF